MSPVRSLSRSMWRAGVSSARSTVAYPGRHSKPSETSLKLLQKGGAGYRPFKGFVFVCTLVMTSRNFYKVGDWYNHSDWRRVRGLLGEPVPNAEIGTSRLQKR